MLSIREMTNLFSAIESGGEPFLEEYSRHLMALNTIVTNSGQKLEGNLFYGHHQEDLTELNIHERTKRKNYVKYVSCGSSLLEIGFNAGHSCLLALTANKSLRYTAVDLGRHSYTQPCFDYLRSVFGERVNLYIGNSLTALPFLAADRTNHSFDLFHIDGDHAPEAALADITNVIRLAKIGDVLLFDDFYAPALRHLCDYFVIRGDLDYVHLHEKSWTPGMQALLRVARRS